MSGVLHGIVASLKAAAAAATDSFFKYVTLLLHGDGTNGAQNNTFLDGSTNAFTITRNGNTTQGSFSPFSQTGWGNYFDGAAGTFLSVPYNNVFDIGTADYTCECWVNLYAFGEIVGAFNLSSPFPGWTMSTNFTLSGKLQIYFGYVGGTSQTITSTASISTFTWTHLAFTKQGSTVKLFINGNLDSTHTLTGTPAASNQQINIGADSNSTTNPGRRITGYISNLRIVKGTAVYTAAFTPPTAPLTAITNTSLLTCQSNRFIDNSSNAFAITRNGDVRVEAFSPFNPSTTYSTANVGGSGYFDGTGDYLTVPDSTAFTFGSGDFTVEAWVWYTTTGGRLFICGQSNSSGTVSTISIYLEKSAANKLRGVVASSSTEYAATSTADLPLNQWVHVAFVRNGNTGTLYINGTSDGTVSLTGITANDSTNLMGVGSCGELTTLTWNGYISNFRIVKGTAVYTANFTPPTAPLTAITNTSLLLNYTNGGIFDNASQTVLETVGNAQVSTAQFKWGTGSMYFDGTGDWLTAIDRPALRFGTGPFTIECWLYLGATGAARGIVGKGTATTGWLLSTDASNKVVFTYGSSTITSTAALSGSTWYFLTVVREGTGTNQTKIYIDGTNDGTGTVSTDFNQTNILYVGADRTGGSAMNGYIDDLRITNGYARYTANFTPPTAAFPDN